MSTACKLSVCGAQKQGARQSHGCVKPSFSEHRYPHASPPVIEPAQGSPRAIRVQPPQEITSQSTQPTHQEMRQPAHVRPSWSGGHGACPRALGAKRVRVRIREKEGFKPSPVWRAPCYQVPKLLACTPGTLTRAWLESAFFASFLCRFGQMTCRHAQ